MELWIADIFDAYYSVPYIVGVYSTEQNAWDGIKILLETFSRDNPKIDLEQRFTCYVTPVQLNGYTPACMDWLGCG